MWTPNKKDGTFTILQEKEVIQHVRTAIGRSQCLCRLSPRGATQASSVSSGGVPVHTAPQPVSQNLHAEAHEAALFKPPGDSDTEVSGALCCSSGSQTSTAPFFLSGYEKLYCQKEKHSDLEDCFYAWLSHCISSSWLLGADSSILSRQEVITPFHVLFKILQTYPGSPEVAYCSTLVLLASKSIPFLSSYNHQICLP